MRGARGVWPWSTAAGCRVVQSSTTVAWRATFEPIRRGLPHAYDWMTFEAFDLLADDKRLAKETAANDVRDGLLRDALPDAYTRTLVAENTQDSELHPCSHTPQGY
jgi:hypothetical protein